MPLFGQETGFSAHVNEIKSGIPRSAPNEDFRRQNKSRACLFEVLFDAVSTRFGLRIIAKYLENTCPTFCSVFENLRLVSIKFFKYFNLGLFQPGLVVDTFDELFEMEIV